MSIGTGTAVAVGGVGLTVAEFVGAGFGADMGGTDGVFAAERSGVARDGGGNKGTVTPVPSGRFVSEGEACLSCSKALHCICSDQRCK